MRPKKLFRCRRVRIVRIIERRPKDDRNGQDQRAGAAEEDPARSAMRKKTVRGEGHL